MLPNILVRKEFTNGKDLREIKKKILKDFSTIETERRNKNNIISKQAKVKTNNLHKHNNAFLTIKEIIASTRKVERDEYKYNISKYKFLELLQIKIIVLMINLSKNQKKNQDVIIDF